MTAREQARALYDHPSDFFIDEMRWVAGFGVRHCTDTAFVLAHLVEVGWPIERMRDDHFQNGNCWFVWCAAGDLSEITEALASRKLTKWVAFERGNHPRLMETNRFLNVRRTNQHQSDSTAGAIPSRTAEDELVSNEVRPASTGGA